MKRAPDKSVGKSIEWKGVHHSEHGDLNDISTHRNPVTPHIIPPQENELRMVSPEFPPEKASEMSQE